MKILLLEDDYLYRVTIKDFLQEYDFVVDDFENGHEALNAIYDTNYSLLLLDIRVPGVDGYEILKEIRKEKILTPVIMLTSLSDIQNLSLGYELGCSDYLRKPFELKELKYRIDYIIKTHCFNTQTNFIILDKTYAFDIKTRRLLKKGVVVDLSATEFEVVSCLIQNRGYFVSIERLRDIVWQGKEITYADIRMCIKRVREKCDKSFILNKKMVGYKIG